MFDFMKQKKQFPVMKMDMFTPPDQQLAKWTDIKRLFLSYLTKIGYCDKQAAEWKLNDLQHEIEQQVEFFKSEIEELKDELKSSKTDLSSLQKDFKKCKDEQEKALLTEEINEIINEITEIEHDIESIIKDMNFFKTDKRGFLIDYINSLVHGKNWRKEHDISS